MPRYRTHSRGWIEDDLYPGDQPLIAGIEVPDHEEIFTGLLDHTGEPIYRAPNPLGFGKDDEW